MLCVINNMDKIVLIISRHIVGFYKLLTVAAVEADEFCVAISAAHPPVFHRCCYLSACIPLLRRLVLPAFLPFLRRIFMIAAAKFVRLGSVMLAIVVADDLFLTVKRHCERE